MSRIVWASLALLLSTGTGVSAQVVIAGGGTTAAGDYLQGLGVASYGMGVFNLYTAQAESIHVDTAIRLHQYVADVMFYENQKNAQIRAQIIAKRKVLYQEIQNRIKQNPEERDVMIGAALNALMDDLRSPQVSSSSLRSNNLQIPAEAIRRIHFRIDTQNLGFSMYRLSPKGEGKWPIGLRYPALAVERRAYERAFDKALEEQIDRRTSNEAIREVEAAISNLENRFEQMGLPQNDTRYKESKNLLREMKGYFELLKSHKAERVIADIETYSGTTVADLKAFMQDHKLRFGPAGDNSPEERKLYVELYELMKRQRELATNPE